MSTRTKLIKAANDGTLVRVYRDHKEPGWAHGYVEGVGKDWFALSLVDDGARFDGFNCIRVKDISKIVPDPHANFLEAAMKKRGEKRRRFKSLDVSSLQSLMRTAMTKYPLLTVHLESDQDNVCYIGRVVTVAGDQVTMREVTPDGTWEPKNSCYEFSAITRVDFGGAYEQALYLVSGAPN